jgi:hypothetical protein
MKTFRQYYLEEYTPEELDIMIDELKDMIDDPCPHRVKEYGGTKYVDMLKRKLQKLISTKAQHK